MGIGSHIASIKRNPESITTHVLRELIRRRRLPETSKALSWSLKVATNSIYGALGAPNSACYSYISASAVTCGGRWLLTAVSSISEKLGYRVVYGDTDSIFLSAKSTNSISAESLVKILHSITSHTPFGNSKLSKDKEFESLILVDPKMYYGILKSNEKSREEIITKGLAPVRKDRPLIVRKSVSEVLFILSSNDRDKIPEVLGNHFFEISH
ncbi:DNA-directed DNA polymerase alpha catalytic subunit pol1 [Coelomomyces lativittatus]|nr:DNA-directed DNA polymerase alpha catalytic subunit pol1 [Coelomomyces lativittatus]